MLYNIKPITADLGSAFWDRQPYTTDLALVIFSVLYPNM